MDGVNSNAEGTDGGNGAECNKVDPIAEAEGEDVGISGPVGTKPGGRSVIVGEDERTGRPRGGEPDAARPAVMYSRGGELLA